MFLFSGPRGGGGGGFGAGGDRVKCCIICIVEVTEE